MALTKEEVLHVAELARLSLKPEVVDLLTRQLNDILAYVEKLQEVDTTGVTPMAHAVPVFNVFREDEVTPSLSREDGLANAPAQEEGTFVVPRVMAQATGGSGSKASTSPAITRSIQGLISS